MITKGKWTDNQRKLMSILALAAILVLFTSAVANAAFFDNAGKSARAMGMGEEFLASSADASGYWYNPAALATYGMRQISISYGKPAMFVSELMTSQINIAMPLGSSSGLGLGVSYGGIEEASDMVISGAYGIAFSKLALGGNVKVLRWAAEGQDNAYGPGVDADPSAVSVSLDLSAMYSMGALMGLDNLTAGVYAKDVLMPNISDSGLDGGELPLEAGLGFLASKGMVVLGFDAGYSGDEAIFRVGTESGITDSNLKVRGGFVFRSDFEDELEKADLNLGLGYQFNTLQFDYAYNYPFAFIETSGKHFVSFGISF